MLTTAAKLKPIKDKKADKNLNKVSAKTFAADNVECCSRNNHPYCRSNTCPSRYKYLVAGHSELFGLELDILLSASDPNIKIVDITPIICTNRQLVSI